MELKAIWEMSDKLFGVREGRESPMLDLIGRRRHRVSALAQNVPRAAIRILGAFALTLAIVGCASPERLLAVPIGQASKATLSDIPNARVRPTDGLGSFVRIFLDAVKRERAYLAKQGHRGALPPANYLAISGGAEDGAFGVGVLVGWTASGTRPVFKTVTGVSTGALIAPFAFLGSQYDETIKTLYTSIGPDSIFEKRGLITAYYQDAFADTAPLRRLVRQHVTMKILAGVAREYEKGRVLLILTTDLDAKIPVVWNMGAIAARGTPQAQRLFQEVLIASAAMPGVFPPVLIDVKVGDKRYQEMHVDGGTISQLFLYPTRLHVRKVARRYNISRKRRVYIIRNARLDPNWASVKRRTLSILGEALSALIAAQGRDAITKIYLAANRDGLDFNLAYIPATFNEKAKVPFENRYMRALYKVGYDLARKGYRWTKKPPGYVD